MIHWQAMQKTHMIAGADLARLLQQKLAEKVAATSKQPSLAIVRVGSDAASGVYIGKKLEACERVGIRGVEVRLPQEATTAQLAARVRELAADAGITGMIVQLPLPDHIDADAVLAAVPAHKDVDGFSPQNLGALFANLPGLRPATPSGVMRLLEWAKVPVAGARAVVLGRSRIVGRPMAAMLTNANATVTLCHSKTPSIAEITREADIVVAAVGRPQFVRGEMLRRGAAVIDVGIHRQEDGSLCGDVHPDAAGVAGFLTPVPGGVGPMTVQCLLENVVQAATAAPVEA